jgi:hypothetical protein
MSEKPTKRKTKNTSKDGPVKPGTPLYRALEMVAHEVAKKLEAKSRPERTSRPPR